MSGTSSLPISAQDALEEQALATMACLIAISTRLPAKQPESNESAHLIKGLYGLAVYSSQYWCDSMFSLAQESQGRLERYPSTVAVIERLVHALDFHNDKSMGSNIPKHPPDDSVAQLDYLRGYPQLQSHIQLLFACRTNKWLEKSFQDSPGMLCILECHSR
jgi:hypothetical protein